MILQDGQCFAVLLAAVVRGYLSRFRRGALDLGSDYVVLFGNDNYEGNLAVQQEVEALRRALRHEEVPEVAFELSPDGVAWLLIVNTNDARYQTAAGRRFRAEMLRAFFADLVTESWHYTAEASGLVA